VPDPGTGAEVELALVRHESFPFERALTERILAVASARELSEVNFVLGERFAEAALGVIQKAGLTPDEVDAIGSHGQTIVHLPSPLSPTPSTFADRRGVGDRRAHRDPGGLRLPHEGHGRRRPGRAFGAVHGLGGVPRQGAHRALQNFGGIGNVSVVGDRLSDTLAFDTGPGNMVLDALARRMTGGELGCDLDGTLSRRGRILPGLLEELLRHPFLALPPPRSAGREGSGSPWWRPCGSASGPARRS